MSTNAGHDSSESFSDCTLPLCTSLSDDDIQAFEVLVLRDSLKHVCIHFGQPAESCYVNLREQYESPVARRRRRGWFLREGTPSTGRGRLLWVRR